MILLIVGYVVVMLSIAVHFTRRWQFEESVPKESLESDAFLALLLGLFWPIATIYWVFQLWSLLVVAVPPKAVRERKRKEALARVIRENEKRSKELLP